LNQQHLVRGIVLAVEKPSEMSRNIRQQSSPLFGEYLGKFPVSLFSIPLPKAEFLHPGKVPDLDMDMAILRDDHGPDIGIDRLRIGREHIPRLEQATPNHVGTNQLFHFSHSRNVPWHCPAGDRNQVEQYENADSTLPEAPIGRTFSP